MTLQWHFNEHLGNIIPIFFWWNFYKYITMFYQNFNNKLQLIYPTSFSSFSRPFLQFVKLLRCRAEFCVVLRLGCMSLSFLSFRRWDIVDKSIFDSLLKCWQTSMLGFMIEHLKDCYEGRCFKQEWGQDGPKRRDSNIRLQVINSGFKPNSIKENGQKLVIIKATNKCLGQIHKDGRVGLFCAWLSFSTLTVVRTPRIWASSMISRTLRIFFANQRLRRASKSFIKASWYIGLLGLQKGSKAESLSYEEILMASGLQSIKLVAG